MADYIYKGVWIKDKVLGSGSFGTVVLWKHKNSSEKIATKTCKWNNELSEKHKERWSKEVEMVNKMNHPNIVSTRELPPELQLYLEPMNPSKLPILCMEYCRGGDLRRLLNMPHFCCGLKEVQVRKILHDLKNGLQFLHYNKITHRDLKPENIVMKITNDSEVIDLSENGVRNIDYKLIDLGYAKEIDANSVCASFVGTLQYLAPEILYRKTYSNSVDYWSIGLIAFEIICGIRPFLPTFAPVQWMPYVKNKSHETISVLLNYHGDIEYSEEVYPENFISSVFKKHIEKWLQTALEWNPKLRGRELHTASFQNESTNKLIIFESLQDILSKRIINIFSIDTMSKYSYEVENTTSITTLKKWLEADTGISVDNQIIISRSSINPIKNEESALTYWVEFQDIMFFLYNRTIVVTDENTFLPKTISGYLENPKIMHSFTDAECIYRNCLYYVTVQMEKYDMLIKGLALRLESIKQESKQLLLIYNSTDKEMSKLNITKEIITNFSEKGIANIQNISEKSKGVNYINGFRKLFAGVNHCNKISEKVQSAWSNISNEIQSVVKHANKSSPIELKPSNYDYKSIHNNAIKAYIEFKKQYSEDKNKAEGYCCHNVIKLCYDCHILKKKMLSEINKQNYILNLNSVGNEIHETTNTITSILNNAKSILASYVMLHNKLSDYLWSSINVLCHDVNNIEVPKQKQEFKIGHCISNHRNNNDHNFVGNGFQSLVEDSLIIRKKHNELVKQLLKQKEEISKHDFDFLDDLKS